MNEDNDHTQAFTVLSKGTMVAHYRIIKKVGSGGMGEVYLADDTKLKRQVALKFLSAHYVADAEFKSRFVREAEAAAKLNHPNIITIYEVSEYQGRPFFAMELVEGQSLQELIHGKELEIDRIIELAVQICEGLGAAHERNVVHRDIKPANIVIDAYGRPKILDFGLAAIEGGEPLTKTGSTLGTIRYMSPEQVQGKKVDHRSDLFSLGAVLYELITGRTPFERANETATLRAITEDEPEPLARFKTGIPDELQRTISKLLDKDVSMRYQSAAGVVSDLKRLLATSPSTQAGRSDKSRRKWPLAISAMIVVAALVVAGFQYWPSEAPAPVKSQAQDRKMLAVLPFENLGTPEDEYFADGITDAITSRLGTIRGLGVISRTSAILYKNSNKSLPEIAAELGVDHILEGTIYWDKKSDPGRVRILPQLIDASDNTHIWADQYDRTLTDIFAMQADIATQIVNALDIALLEGEARALGSVPTRNMEAYDYYLRGIDYLSEGYVEADLLSAVEMFEQSIRLDTAFALAYVALSQAQTSLCFLSVGVKERSVQAKKAIDNAIRLEPDLPEAHLALGYYFNLIEQDFDLALQEFEIARKSLANHSDMYSMIAFVQMRQGEWEKSLQNHKKAVQLDPRSASKNLDVSIAYAYMQRFSEAGLFIDRAISLSPTQSYLYWQKLSICLLMGHVQRAKETIKSLPSEVDEADALWTDLYLGTYNLGLWRFGLTDRHPSEMLARLRTTYTGSKRHAYYFSMAQLYDLVNQPDSSHIYYDSARTFIRQELKNNQDNFHLHTDLGLACAFLGYHDEAIAEVERGMELMPTSSCHW